MNFCTHCGHRVVSKIPPGDQLPRFVCESCGTVHYQNPNMVVGCVCTWEERILLCKRAIQPRSGLWTVPAGFLENGETLEQAAARETKEEALATVDIGQLLAVINVSHANQVHVMFRGELTDGRFGAGDETMEAMLVTPEEIPWDLIAFPSVTYTLERFLEDRERGASDVHVTAVGRIKY